MVSVPAAGPSKVTDIRKEAVGFSQSAEIYQEEREVFLSKSDRQLSIDFIQEMLPSTEGEKIINDDQIWKEQIFQHTVLITAKKWNTYNVLLKTYEEGRTKQKKSKLFTKINAIKDVLDDVRGSFEAVSIAEVSPRMGLTLLEKNVKLRKELLMTNVKALCKLQSLVNDKDLLNSLRRRFRQQEVTENSRFHRQDTEMRELYIVLWK